MNGSLARRLSSLALVAVLSGCASSSVTDVSIEVAVHPALDVPPFQRILARPDVRRLQSRYQHPDPGVRGRQNSAVANNIQAVVAPRLARFGVRFKW